MSEVVQSSSESVSTIFSREILHGNFPSKTFIKIASVVFAKTLSLSSSSSI